MRAAETGCERRGTCEEYANGVLLFSPLPLQLPTINWPYNNIVFQYQLISNPLPPTHPSPTDALTATWIVFVIALEGVCLLSN